MKLQNKTKPQNDQDVLDKVYQHFIVDENPRCIERGVCMYRNHEGEGCVIGIFMPDEMVDELQLIGGSGSAIKELLSGSLLKIDRKKIQDWFINCNELFLADLQHWHDECDLNEEALHGLAVKYKLNMPTT